ncbi:MAG: cation transporter [Oscillospiraceae bacterium]|nr:cation transporter [Oscillospiraceae bacterium]
MKTERNILTAFILNLAFSVFEFVGGTLTGSVAVVSDAIHDMGDAASIGCAWFLERRSRRQPDDTHTYGYGRYSALGSAVITLMLLLSSSAVIYNAVNRIFHPVEIHYDGMILMAVIGTAVNFAAAWFTRGGDSLNEKAVSLHMLEDVLGWLVVLAGAVIMRFTDISLIDPLMSIGVAVFILVSAVKNLTEIVDLFLEKTPEGVSVARIKEHLCSMEEILDVHHIHVWSRDGHSSCATMHIVTDEDPVSVKRKVRAELSEHGIGHVTLELETGTEQCGEECCSVQLSRGGHHHHHHHHHG